VLFAVSTSQVWPKVIEIAAPLLFYAMTPAAYLATTATYRSAFIIINFWFVVAELVFWVLAKRNFIEEYFMDWNPKEVRQQGLGSLWFRGRKDRFCGRDTQQCSSFQSSDYKSAQIGFMVLARRNFIEEYFMDWNPKEVRQQGLGFFSELGAG
jgi:hypothetical protein